jgi:hypothetical protein
MAYTARMNGARIYQGNLSWFWTLLKDGEAVADLSLIKGKVTEIQWRSVDAQDDLKSQHAAIEEFIEALVGNYKTLGDVRDGKATE